MRFRSHLLKIILVNSRNDISKTHFKNYCRTIILYTVLLNVISFTDYLSFFAADTTPPVLNGCLTGIITVAIPAGFTSTIVLWTPPTATDNSGINPTPVASPRGPGVYAAGFYLITYTATDGANNVATCSFNLLVQVTQPTSK